ncbi:metallophosphoesterase [Candidatus Woesearchaeota archaeon]|jgi:predicted phosphodiesterase|nr:metallophosphoesterase [Candidatus Woesearchaeota archaeon]
MRIGLISDNHEGGFERKIAEALKGEDVDAIVSLGDAIEIPTNSERLIRVQQIFCETGIPFYSTAGNHEGYQAWVRASEVVCQRYDNFYDAALQHIFRINGISFVFVPGTEGMDDDFLVANGKTGLKKIDGRECYVTSTKQIERMLKEQSIDTSKTILFTHQPPEQGYRNGTDSLVGTDYEIVENPLEADGITDEERDFYELHQMIGQGSMQTRMLIKKTGIPLVCSGHLHRKTSAINHSGEDLVEGDVSNTMYITPGMAGRGEFAILETDDSTGNLVASYEKRNVQ